jgi:prophage tail gpP-like protein
VRVRIRGRTFQGWKQVRIFRSLENAAGGFEIRMRDIGPRAILPGQKIEIEFGDGSDRTLLDGFVDRYRARTSEATASVTGRDKTSDLIDSSAGIFAAGDDRLEFNNIALIDLVRTLASPFDVTVLVNNAPTIERFKKFAVEPGETVWSAIDRAIRLRAMLAYPDGRGRLLIARPGAQHAETDLIEGENVIDAEIELSHADRYALYIVRGQRPGSDDEDSELVAAVEGSASDAEITRFRPLLVLAEGSVTSSSAQIRAEWEAIIRAARSSTLKVKTRGWRELADTTLIRSDPWQVNKIVRARIPSHEIDTDFLISAVSYSAGDDGIVSELTLVRKDAYTPQSTLEKEDSGFQKFLDEWDAAEASSATGGEF